MPEEADASPKPRKTELWRGGSRRYPGTPTHHLTSRLSTWGQKSLQMIIDPSPVTLSECTMLTSFPGTANTTCYGGHSRVGVQLSGDSGPLGSFGVEFLFPVASEIPGVPQHQIEGRGKGDSPLSTFNL